MEVEIQGLDELYRVLQELPVRIEKNVLRGGLRAGATVLRDEAKRNVPVRSGALRDSIRVSTRARRGVVNALIRAGGGRAVKGKAQGAFYAHIVEFGAKPHVIRSRTPGGKLRLQGGQLVSAVHHPGSQPRRFMRPAFDRGGRKAVDRTAEYGRDRRPGEIAKLRR